MYVFNFVHRFGRFFKSFGLNGYRCAVKIVAQVPPNAFNWTEFYSVGFGLEDSGCFPHSLASGANRVYPPFTKNDIISYFGT